MRWIIHPMPFLAYSPTVDRKGPRTLPELSVGNFWALAGGSVWHGLWNYQPGSWQSRGQEEIQTQEIRSWRERSVVHFFFLLALTYQSISSHSRLLSQKNNRSRCHPLNLAFVLSLFVRNHWFGQSASCVDHVFISKIIGLVLQVALYCLLVVRLGEQVQLAHLFDRFCRTIFLSLVSVVVSFHSLHSLFHCHWRLWYFLVSLFSSICALSFLFCAHPTDSDCILHGYIKKLGGPFASAWQTRYARLYPNRLELHYESSSSKPELVLMDHVEEINSELTTFKGEQSILLRTKEGGRVVLTNQVK